MAAPLPDSPGNPNEENKLSDLWRADTDEAARYLLQNYGDRLMALCVVASAHALPAAWTRKTSCNRSCAPSSAG